MPKSVIFRPLRQREKWRVTCSTDIGVAVRSQCVRSSKHVGRCSLKVRLASRHLFQPVLVFAGACVLSNEPHCLPRFLKRSGALLDRPDLACARLVRPVIPARESAAPSMVRRGHDGEVPSHAAPSRSPRNHGGNTRRLPLSSEKPLSPCLTFRPPLSPYEKPPSAVPVRHSSRGSSLFSSEKSPSAVACQTFEPPEVPASVSKAGEVFRCGGVAV